MNAVYKSTDCGVNSSAPLPLKTQIIDLLKQGRTPRQIADTLGCNRHYARAVRSQAGLAGPPLGPGRGRRRRAYTIRQDNLRELALKLWHMRQEDSL